MKQRSPSSELEGEIYINFNSVMKELEFICIAGI